MKLLKEIYCRKCRRFLGKEDIKEGRVELKCPNCKIWNVVEGREIKEDDVLTILVWHDSNENSLDFMGGAGSYLEVHKIN